MHIWCLAGLAVVKFASGRKHAARFKREWTALKDKVLAVTNISYFWTLKRCPEWSWQAHCSCNSALTITRGAYFGPVHRRSGKHFHYWWTTYSDYLSLHAYFPADLEPDADRSRKPSADDDLASGGNRQCFRASGVAGRYPKNRHPGQAFLFCAPFIVYSSIRNSTFKFRQQPDIVANFYNKYLHMNVNK